MTIQGAVSPPVHKEDGTNNVHFRLNRDVIESLFASRCGAFEKAIRMSAEGFEKEFRQINAGHRFHLLAYQNCVIAAGQTLNFEGSSRVSVNFYDKVAPATGEEHVPGWPTLRLDIPTVLLREKVKPLFWLYNIRFQLLTPDDEVDARGMRPFRVGYYGITKRSVFERFKEHSAKVANGTGHILHKAWGGLIRSGTPFHPVIQVSATMTSLDQIYAAEEAAVEQVSLTPRGLNAIPGGYAGIKMLHQLALLSENSRVSPEDRDAALDKLERAPSTKCTHYRSGHMRKLPGGKSVWVSPCWINLSESAP